MVTRPLPTSVPGLMASRSFWAPCYANSFNHTTHEQIDRPKTNVKKLSFSRENGPCNFAMPNHAFPARRLKRGTPDDGAQRVGPVPMLFVVGPIQSKPDGRHHRTK